MLKGFDRQLEWIGQIPIGLVRLEYHPLIILPNFFQGSLLIQKRKGVPDYLTNFLLQMSEKILPHGAEINQISTLCFLLGWQKRQIWA